MAKNLKPVPEGNKGLPKLPTKVRNKMGFMRHGGPVNAHKQEAMSPCPKPRVRGYEKGGGVTLPRSETTIIPDHEGPRKDSDYYDYLSSAEKAGSAGVGAIGGIGSGLGKGKPVLPKKKPKRKTDKERLLEKVRKKAKE